MTDREGLEATIDNLLAKQQEIADLLAGTAYEKPAADIIANGSPSPKSIPTYAQRINLLRTEWKKAHQGAADAESLLHRWRSVARRLDGTRQHLILQRDAWIEYQRPDLADLAGGLLDNCSDPDLRTRAASHGLIAQSDDTWTRTALGEGFLQYLMGRDPAKVQAGTREPAPPKIEVGKWAWSVGDARYIGGDFDTAQVALDDALATLRPEFRPINVAQVCRVTSLADLFLDIFAPRCLETEARLGGNDCGFSLGESTWADLSEWLRRAVQDFARVAAAEPAYFEVDEGHARVVDGDAFDDPETR